MNQTGVSQVELRPGQHDMWKEEKKINQRRKLLKQNTTRPRTQDNMGKTTIVGPERNPEATQQRSEVHIRKGIHNQETAPNTKE